MIAATDSGVVGALDSVTDARAAVETPLADGAHTPNDWDEGNSELGPR